MGVTDRRVGTGGLSMIKRAILTATLLGVFGAAQAQEPPRWPDTYVARLEALALIQTLNAEILASRSATTILENWCRDHRLADTPQIRARLVTGISKTPTTEQRQRLEISPEHEVK